MTPIKQRVLRKANDDVCYVCRADRGPARLEFAVSNALLHEASQESLAPRHASTFPRSCIRVLAVMVVYPRFARDLLIAT